MSKTKHMSRDAHLNEHKETQGRDECRNQGSLCGDRGAAIGMRPYEGALLGGWQVLFFIFAVVTRADTCRQVCMVFYFILQWKG